MIAIGIDRPKQRPQRHRIVLRSGAAIIGVVGTLFLCPAPALAGDCRDPWITQAIREVTGRDPNGSYESGECTYTQYNRGSWNSYPELKGYVQQRLGSNLGVNRKDFSGISMDQYNALPKWNGNGQTWAYYNGRWMQVIAQGGGNMKMISSDGASIVINQGSNLITDNGGG